MILLMGVAGAGKSLEGRRLADEMALPWLSTGEFLRMLVAGDRRREMLAGKLLSDEEVIELADRVFRIIDVKEEFLLDGFPRTQAQADWLLAQHKAKLMNITAVINLEASQEVVKERLLGRGRQDDTDESIAERFYEYESVTLPIISNLESKGIKVHHINAAQTPDEVHRDVLNALGV
ncbi:MAG: nucleoside monophosphate kinase [bacterium]|nr:nucleoside monophosphate kinase [bacterium]